MRLPQGLLALGYSLECCASLAMLRTKHWEPIDRHCRRPYVFTVRLSIAPVSLSAMLCFRCVMLWSPLSARTVAFWLEYYGLASMDSIRSDMLALRDHLDRVAPSWRRLLLVVGFPWCDRWRPYVGCGLSWFRRCFGLFSAVAWCLALRVAQSGFRLCLARVSLCVVVCSAG